MVGNYSNDIIMEMEFLPNYFPIFLPASEIGKSGRNSRDWYLSLTINLE